MPKSHRTPRRRAPSFKGEQSCATTLFGHAGYCLNLGCYSKPGKPRGSIYANFINTRLKSQKGAKTKITPDVPNAVLEWKCYLLFLTTSNDTFLGKAAPRCELSYRQGIKCNLNGTQERRLRTNESTGLHLKRHQRSLPILWPSPSPTRIIPSTKTVTLHLASQDWSGSWLSRTLFERDGPG